MSLAFTFPDRRFMTSMRLQIHGERNSPRFHSLSTTVPCCMLRGFTEISSENGSANSADDTASSIASDSVRYGGFRSR